MKKILPDERAHEEVAALEAAERANRHWNRMQRNTLGLMDYLSTDKETKSRTTSRRAEAEGEFEAAVWFAGAMLGREALSDETNLQT